MPKRWPDPDDDRRRPRCVEQGLVILGLDVFALSTPCAIVGYAIHPMIGDVLGVVAMGGLVVWIGGGVAWAFKGWNA